MAAASGKARGQAERGVGGLRRLRRHSRSRRSRALRARARPQVGDRAVLERRFAEWPYDPATLSRRSHGSIVRSPVRRLRRAPSTTGSGQVDPMSRPRRSPQVLRSGVPIKVPQMHRDDQLRHGAPRPSRHQRALEARSTTLFSAEGADDHEFDEGLAASVASKEVKVIKAEQTSPRPDPGRASTTCSTTTRSSPTSSSVTSSSSRACPSSARRVPGAPGRAQAHRAEVPRGAGPSCSPRSSGSRSSRRSSPRRGSSRWLRPRTVRTPTCMYAQPMPGDGRC